ncbi:hypothetical protein AB0I02_36940 [Streptomyces phaeochromogenes]
MSFPHATRALLVERYTTGRGDGKIHADAEIGITTAPSDAADAAVPARCVRGRWATEAQHFVRDVTFGETPAAPAPAACPGPSHPSAA